MKKIIIATGNNHKFKEIVEIFSIPEIAFSSMKDFPDLNKINENGKTFQENALIKAKEVFDHTGLITIADDSGLEIEALDNQPGIHSSRFLGEDTDYKIKNLKILDMLKSVPIEKRTARFVCAIAVYGGENNYKIVKGICEGRIAFEIRGDSGFGYDPIFLVPEYDSTFGELADEIKNKISHRAVALAKAKDVVLGMIGS